MFAKKPEPRAGWRLRSDRAEPASRLLLVRTALVGALAIAGAAWALIRHYTHALPPLRVPVPVAAPTYDRDAGEVPVPEWLEPERKAP